MLLGQVFKFVPRFTHFDTEQFGFGTTGNGATIFFSE